MVPVLSALMKLTTTLITLALCLSVGSGATMRRRRGGRSDESLEHEPRAKSNGVFFKNGKWSYPVLSSFKALGDARKRRQEHEAAFKSLGKPPSLEDFKFPEIPEVVKGPFYWERQKGNLLSYLESGTNNPKEKVSYRKRLLDFLMRSGTSSEVLSIFDSKQLEKICEELGLLLIEAKRQVNVHEQRMNGYLQDMNAIRDELKTPSSTVHSGTDLNSLTSSYSQLRERAQKEKNRFANEDWLAAIKNVDRIIAEVNSDFKSRKHSLLKGADVGA